MKLEKSDIQKFVLRNGYLLVITAWLITLSFLVNNYWLYISSPTHVRKLLQENVQQREKKFDKLVSDSSLMDKFLNRDYNQNELNKYLGGESDLNLFFYYKDWETFWSTNQIAMDSSLNQLAEGVYFKKLKSGYYEIIRKNLDSNSYVLGVIPVKEQYYFSNQYLPKRFYQLPRISNQYEITMDNRGMPIKSISGKVLFNIYNSSGEPLHHTVWLSGILIGLALLFINIFFNQCALFIGRRSNPWWGGLFLLTLFFVLRLSNYLGIVRLGFHQFELFDSTIYASNFIFRSLGDLLINVILIIWLILYAYNQIRPQVKLKVDWSRFHRYAYMFLLNLFTFYLVYFAVELIRGLVINSKISFDVTDFFSLNIYSFVGLVILSLLGFSFLFLSPTINKIQIQLSNHKLIEKYIIIGIAGFIWLMFQMFFGMELYSIWVMIWIVGYFYLLDLMTSILKERFRLERFILWLFIVTVSITAIVIHYNGQRELNYRKQLVIKLTKQQDPTLIFNLSMTDSIMVKDPQVLSYYIDFEHSDKRKLKDYLLKQYFSNLQNSYDFEFYTFNEEGYQNKEEGKDANEVSDKLLEGGELTGFLDLYFKQIHLTDYYYVSTLAINNPKEKKTLGYLYYRLTPKLIKPESLYPELLMQTEDYQFKNAIKDYAYAVYDHKTLTYHKNGFPFPMKISFSEIPNSGFIHFKEKGYSILRYKAAPHKVIVMVKKQKTLLETMTFFAYLFITFLLLLLLFNVFRILLKSRLRYRILRELIQLNIRNKIYGLIIFIVIFVFVVLGISTIKFFIGRYDNQHKERLDNEVNGLLVKVQHDLNKKFNPAYQNIAYSEDLEHKIREIANREGVDINIFDLNGNLRITTQSLIYKNGLLSRKIDPDAYYKLQFLHQVQVTQKERIGDLYFLSSYVPIQSKDGELIAFFNLPNYASQSDLQSEISNFLVTLINLNAFIFLLAGILALFLTHSIARSFSLIIEKMKNVKLTGRNEEIEWTYDDEIGTLIREYNKMVHKLEESADKLAKSEREGAWRKMARQVAHEIKNPLTPMKLSLQHLQIAIQKDSPRKNELTNKVSQTIIEQIDHLSQIASDFSTFANIAYARKEKIVLNDVLSSVTSLYQGDEHVVLTYIEPEETYEIVADKTQINRVFANLILNAMQAVPEEKEGAIHIETDKGDGYVVVSVEDNGSGIDAELEERIFTPNFTTKSSGTGLGLAICKNIVVQYGGDIWFETDRNEGTTFFVKLPLKTALNS